MYKLNNDNKKLFIALVVVFVFGQLVIGFVGWALYDLLYYANYDYNFLLIFIRKLIIISYVIYSYLYILPIIRNLKNDIIKKGMMSLLLVFYVLSIFSVTFLHSFTPITYLSGFLYNGVVYEEWNKDIRTSRLDEQIKKLEKWKRGDNA